MHIIKLNVDDSVLDKIMYFLQNLPKNKVFIVENKVVNDSVIEDDLEVQVYSNHSANLIEEWRDDSEDEVWK